MTDEIDIARYARQTALPEIGIGGQRRLNNARVLIVGVGGLGSPAALYLAAAGVGHLGLCDADTVSVSNLQRQILYIEAEVGQPKAECAKRRLQALNPNIDITTYQTRLSSENARDIISRYDYVVDGCDNFATRYLIDDICKSLHKIYIYGAITDFTGQVAVFDYHAGISYATLCPDRDYYVSLCHSVPAPVVGTTPAVVGSIQANQVIQLICGFGSPAIDTLINVDLLAMSVDRIKL